MDDYPHLANAPIVEAVVDIAVVLAPSVAVQDLDPFVQEVADAYPEAEEIRAQQFQFAGREFAASAPSAVVGRMCWSKGRNQAVQARLNGFTLNLVGHYDSWQATRDQARRLWDRYQSIAKPLAVKRCALRYINQLEFPVEEEIADYMRMYPEMPGEFSVVDEYTMRVVLPFENDRKCAVTQVMQGAVEGASHARLVLDIDAYVVRDIDPNSSDVWSEFEALRGIKNSCFFRALQPLALEAYR